MSSRAAIALAVALALAVPAYADDTGRRFPEKSSGTSSSPALESSLPSLGLSAADLFSTATIGQLGTDYSELPRDGRLTVTGGLGFTSDPSTFLLAVSSDFYVLHNLAIGPLLQLGIDDDDFILAPAFYAKGVFDLPDPALERWKLFALGGLGLAHIDKDRRGDDDETGVLITLGGGSDFYLSDEVSVGTTVLFNILPDEVLDEYFFLSWQVITLSFHF